MRCFYNALVICTALLLSCSRKTENPESTSTSQTPLFKLIPPEETGIDCVNEVVDGEKFNILTYRNFYNGGGVAIGDTNNDSLPALYLTANQKQNKLYSTK